MCVGNKIIDDHSKVMVEKWGMSFTSRCGVEISTDLEPSARELRFLIFPYIYPPKSKVFRHKRTARGCFSFGPEGVVWPLASSAICRPDNPFALRLFHAIREYYAIHTYIIWTCILFYGPIISVSMALSVPVLQRLCKWWKAPAWKDTNRRILARVCFAKRLSLS